eukprot:2014267-Amphidinium_carterae.1
MAPPEELSAALVLKEQTEPRSFLRQAIWPRLAGMPDCGLLARPLVASVLPILVKPATVHETHVRIVQ